ncbi:MAG: hypothetical protein V1877_02195 [Candidatus Tagabacteria bacterium]
MYTFWHLIKVFLNQSSIKSTFTYIFEGWFIWAPILAGYLFWESWLNYIHSVFIRNLSWVLLEIKIPREIAKSPRAMEVVLSALYNIRDGNLVDRFWKGFLRLWYSLEIVSIGGQIHFFLYIQTPLRNLVESQIYAQYPGAEITEAEDYTKIISPLDIKEEWGLSGAEFTLLKEEAYPIRTYIEFGLEAGKTKEEEKTDPLTSFLEALGSLKEGEQIWFQILIRGAAKDWKEKAEKVIDELKTQKGASAEVSPEDAFTRSLLTPGQREVLQAVERNVAKIGFETGIRAIYLAEKDIFDRERSGFVRSTLGQYNTQNMNGFKPAKGRSTSVDYFKRYREPRKKRSILRAYQKRSYFYIPYRRKSFVLNTEALATIFHFPGRVAETPTLGRIEAKRGEPPINLPI